MIAANIPITVKELMENESAVKPSEKKNSVENTVGVQEHFFLN